MLSQQLGARSVVVGHDFRFGRQGAATAEVLAQAGSALGFEVEVVPPVALDGERISSSGDSRRARGGATSRAPRAGSGGPIR